MKGTIWVKLGLLALLLVGVGLLLKAFGIDLTKISPERVRAFVLSFGAWAPAAYLIGYGQPIVPLPDSIMPLAAGLAFGPAWGTAAALTGATIRASSEFLVARLLGRDAVAKLLKGNVAKLDQRISENGFRTVLLIRLIPNLPFDVQNYGLGFTQVRFPAYVLGTFLGMIPGCFALVYLGYSLTNPKQIWKLAVAIGLVIGLLVGTSSWKKRHATAGGSR